MDNEFLGQIAGLLTAVFWTVSAIAFEKATIRAGTYAVNIIRLVIGLVFLSILNFIMRGLLLPVDAGLHSWFWLFISGLVGFVIGDLFLFAAFTIISSRISMLIMTLAPPMAAILGRIFLNEQLNILSIAGMILVLSGIALTVWSRPDGDKKIKLNFPAKGLFFAFMGALGQAGGLLLSKIGMKNYNAFASTQIRVIAGIIGFSVLITLMKKWGNVFSAVKNQQTMASTGIGSIFGPFLGVSFSLLAVQNTKTGIAATLMSIVPVLIIIPSVFIYKQKVDNRELFGAFISVCGVILFFL